MHERITDSEARDNMRKEYHCWTSRRVNRRNKSQEILVRERQVDNSENNVIVSCKARLSGQVQVNENVPHTLEWSQTRSVLRGKTSTLVLKRQRKNSGRTRIDSCFPCCCIMYASCIGDSEGPERPVLLMASSLLFLP